MKFYALYSKSQQAYNTPFLAHDDEEAVAIISKTVTAYQDNALIMSLDDLRLEKVGRFSPKADFPVNTATIDIVLDDLHTNLPLPPMIRSQVGKLYAPKEAQHE